MKYAVVSDASKFIALSDLRIAGTGKLFEKEILRRGKVQYKGQMLDINDDLMDRMVANFAAGICDIVQVPMVGDDNQHTEAPDRNLGEVVGLRRQGDSVIATVDVRKPEMAEQVGKTLLGGSAMYALDYTDTRTGNLVGPTLLHLAVTNRPRFTGLEPFRELVAASADTAIDDVGMFTTGDDEGAKVPKTLAELAAELKADHNIDLEDLQTKLAAATKTPAAAEPDPVLASLSNLLVQHGIIKLSNGEATAKPEEVVAQVVKMSGEIVALSGTVKTLTDSARASEVDGLVKTGHILPAQRDGMVKLAISDHETFLSILPAEPVVKLSGELGNDGATELAPGGKIVALSVTADEQAQIDRYAAMANGQKVKV